MGQLFFKNNIESKFIKNLLSNVKIPVNKVVSPGDVLLAGNTYTYRDETILCTSSGVLMAEDYVLTDEHFIGTTCTYKALKSPIRYKGGFKSPYNMYDPETHRHLGEYLRVYGKYTGINLMPYYNCFCYKQTSDFYLTDTGYVFGSSDKYRVFLVPVKFNRAYNIYLDSVSDIKILPVVYSDFGMTAYSVEDDVYLTDILDVGVSVYPSSNFKRPIRYTVYNDYFIKNTSNPEHGLLTSKVLESHEDELYLAIQVNHSSKSSIVVLEGDYENYPEANKGDFIKANTYYRSDDGIIYCSNPGIYDNEVESISLEDVVGGDSGSIVATDIVDTNIYKNLFDRNAFISKYGSSYRKANTVSENLKVNNKGLRVYESEEVLTEIGYDYSVENPVYAISLRKIFGAEIDIDFSNLREDVVYDMFFTCKVSNPNFPARFKLVGVPSASSRIVAGNKVLVSDSTIVGDDTASTLLSSGEYKRYHVTFKGASGAVFEFSDMPQNSSEDEYLFLDITSIVICESGSELSDGELYLRYPTSYYDIDDDGKKVEVFYKDLTYDYQGAYASYIGSFWEADAYEDDQSENTQSESNLSSLPDVSYPTFSVPEWASNNQYSYRSLVAVGGDSPEVYMLVRDFSAGDIVDLSDTYDAILVAKGRYVTEKMSGNMLPVLSLNQSDAYVSVLSSAYNLSSTPSLIKYNDGNIFAFSDRLLEYLLLNVITPSDTISENLRLFHRCIGSKEIPYADEKTRIRLYNLYMEKNPNSYDISGNIDKDVEEYFSNKLNKVTNEDWTSGRSSGGAYFDGLRR